MKIKFYLNSKLFIISTGLVLFFCIVQNITAQKRDNLTDKEDLIIREAQELDARMKVLSKVIDRRLQALGEVQIIDSKKKKEKDESDWGELRTGTIGELFWDINKTLDEAIMRIDDVAEREMNNPLFGKSVHILAENCQKWNPKFKIFLDKTTDEKDRGSVLSSIEHCTQITEASKKVSKEVPKKKN